MEKKVIKCMNKNCGYIWETRSTKKFVSCPDCLSKVLNVVYDKTEKEGKK